MRYSLSEYILYINLRLAAGLFQALPVRPALFIGRALGILGYLFDSNHKRIAYRNLRTAKAGECSIPQLKAILKRNYENLGMNMVETLRLPRIDKHYINRYIKIKGRENLDRVLKNQRGAIVLGAHFGSWEIYSAIAGILGYPLCIFAEEQTNNPLLDRFLNQTRQKQGISVLRVGQQMRQVIRALQEEKFVGMVADHGMKEGVFVDFFGRKTRTPTAAVRISLKFDVPILVVYLRRVKGPEHEVVISPPLAIKRTGNFGEDIISNLEMINRITEDYISKYPEQYLWFYKRFKYSSQCNILILHDGRVGHLRQSQAIGRLVENIARQRHLEVKTKLLKIDFKNKSVPILQSLSVSLAYRHTCGGCLLCLRTFLKRETFQELQSYFADIVISCGWRTAAVNFVISSENQARSVVIMRPGLLSIKRFDLVIMPRHDIPPKKRNIVVIEGALNLIDNEYMDNCISHIARRISQEDDKRPFNVAQGPSAKSPEPVEGLAISDKQLVLGLLLGGDTKRFNLSSDLLKPLISQIKLFLEKYDGQILITTSRRTSPEVEDLIKQEFSNYSRCRLLVIANERNIPQAVGGILGLSKIVIVSPESISMISEAASSGRYVVVFNPQTNIGGRHSQFLEHFAKEKYIYLTDSSQILRTLKEIIAQKPEIVKLQDSLVVKEALERLL